MRLFRSINEIKILYLKIEIYNFQILNLLCACVKKVSSLLCSQLNQSRIALVKGRIHFLVRKQVSALGGGENVDWAAALAPLRGRDHDCGRSCRHAGDEQAWSERERGQPGRKRHQRR